MGRRLIVTEPVDPVVVLEIFEGVLDAPAPDEAPGEVGARRAHVRGEDLEGDLSILKDAQLAHLSDAVQGNRLIGDVLRSRRRTSRSAAKEDEPRSNA